ncbi:UNVERIFIED_CONTAM: hypothetical protein FKN15_074051 [Acipenser sinensis]
MAQVLAKKAGHLCPGQRALHSPPASAVLDETCCCRIMCQHPLCWEAHLRCARGVPRYTAARAEPPEPQEDGLPTLKIQNIPGWSDDDPDGTDPGPFPRTFNSSEPSHLTAAHTKECSVIESSEVLHFPGRNSPRATRTLLMSERGFSPDPFYEKKRKKPFKLSHSVSLSTGGRKMAKQSIWAGRTERDSDVAQAEAVEPQPAQNKAARPKQQHGEQLLLHNRGVVLHSARGKKQSLEAGSGQGPGGFQYRLDDKSTDSPGKDKVDWESLGRQPLLWRRYLMSASRGKSKTAGPALPSCSAWTKDSRRSSYDAEGSTAQPTHLPDSAASSGLSPHSTAQLLQHAMCPLRQSESSPRDSNRTDSIVIWVPNPQRSSQRIKPPGQTNSKPALLLSGKSERICISELIYSLPPSQTDKAHKMKRKKPFKLSHSVSLSTGGRKMAKQSIWAGRTERDSDVAQAEAVEPQPAQNKAARPKQQHGEQLLLHNRGVVLHSARGKKQSLEAGSGQGPGGFQYRLDNKSTDSPGKDKVDWESLGRQPLLWRRYLMSASRGKSKTAGPKSSRQLSQPLDPWVNFGIYSSSRDTMENIHPGQLPILEIGPALPSCSAWTKDSRRSSYDAEGSTAQPTHLPDSAASSGLSPHSTAQLLQHAMCPTSESELNRESWVIIPPVKSIHWIQKTAEQEPEAVVSTGARCSVLVLCWFSAGSGDLVSVEELGKLSKGTCL